MAEPKKQSFLGGAAVLAGAALVVKLIGAAYKIPLNNILGVHGIVIPEEIDKDLYDKLMTLKKGTNARSDYIESLRPRLSAEALEACSNTQVAAVLATINRSLEDGEVAQPATVQRKPRRRSGPSAAPAAAGTYAIQCA